jgi:hypothetical protein
MSIKGGGGEQLKMFMTPRELGGFVDSYADFGPNPGGLPHEAMQSMNGPFDRFDFKMGNLERTGMGDSIAADGVRKPLDVQHDPNTGERSLLNGHHRAIKQSMADPDRLMPVIHTSSVPNEADDAAREVFKTIGGAGSDPTGQK